MLINNVIMCNLSYAYNFYYRNNNLLRYLAGTPASLTTLQVRGNRQAIYKLKLNIIKLPCIVATITEIERSCKHYFKTCKSLKKISVVHIVNILTYCTLVIISYSAPYPQNTRKMTN